MKRVLAIVVVLAAIGLAWLLLGRTGDDAKPSSAAPSKAGAASPAKAGAGTPPMAGTVTPGNADAPSALSPGPSVRGPRRVDLALADVPPAQASARIEALAAQFDRGEAAAAGYELSTLLESCANAREAVDALALARRTGGKVDRPVFPAQEVLARECRSIPAELLARRSAIRERAAASGDLRAQVTYWQFPPPELRSEDGAFRNPEKVIEFKSRALGYLDAAAQSGAVQAMQSLADVYTEGTLAPQDRVMALAYYLARVAIAPDTDPTQSDRAQYEAGLTPQELDRARVLRERILKGG